MHEAHEGRPDRRPDQGTPGDDAQALAEDLDRFFEYCEENEASWEEDDPRLAGRRAFGACQETLRQHLKTEDADLETAARLGIEVGQLLFSEPFNRDSRELDRLVPAWARRFNAEHAGETWEGIEYTDTVALFALRRFQEWARGDPQC